MNQPGGTLIVRRDKGYVDKARAYKILVDGQEVDRIKQNEEVAHPLVPGRHRLELKLDWVTSPPETFDVAPGQTVVFTCRPNPHAANVLLYITVKRKQYLALERV